jgi:hypothetical protein
MSLEEVLREIDEKAEEFLKRLKERVGLVVPRGHKWYYCPKCLHADHFTPYAVKKGKTVCPWCWEPMKPLDEEFFKRSEEVVRDWKGKAKALIEKVWDVLRGWWPHKPMMIGADYEDYREVTLYFDYPSFLKVGLERTKEGLELRASLYAHYFSERNVPMLQKVIEVAREVGIKMRVGIDDRPDHCTVPKEKMEEMGFRRDFGGWIMDVSQ